MNLKPVSDGFKSLLKETKSYIKKICGESASVDLTVSNEWINSKLPNILSGYKMCDVYNADESGLYWRALPNNTYYVNEDECKGQKRSKERVTFLAITNWDGSDRKRLIVIGKSKNPRCFKNIKSLPVRYYANKTAWMQTDIFTEILNNWNKKLIKENRNILLFLDNCNF